MLDFRAKKHRYFPDLVTCVRLLNSGAKTGSWYSLRPCVLPQMGASSAKLAKVLHRDSTQKAIDALFDELWEAEKDYLQPFE